MGKVYSIKYFLVQLSFLSHVGHCRCPTAYRLAEGFPKVRKLLFLRTICVRAYQYSKYVRGQVHFCCTGVGKEGGGSEGNAGRWRKVPSSWFAEKFDFFPILKGAKWLQSRQRDGTGEQKNPKMHLSWILKAYFLGCRWWNHCIRGQTSKPH